MVSGEVILRATPKAGRALLRRSPGCPEFRGCDTADRFFAVPVRDVESCKALAGVIHSWPRPDLYR